MHSYTRPKDGSAHGLIPAQRLNTCLITGGAGFFGDVLKTKLLKSGISCISIDVQPDGSYHPRLRAIRADIRESAVLDTLMSERCVDAVFHCAAILGHDVKSRRRLWDVNVCATRTLAKLMVKHNIPKMVFVSSNCLWGRSLGRPVTEDDEPCPIEIYGRSKWEAEKALREFGDDLDVTVLRSPTIVGSGRLGLLGILFEFIREGRNVPVVGSGANRYQFIYAPDLADACVRAALCPGREVFNVGSDDVKPLRDVYEEVIKRAGTGAGVVSLPRTPMLALMRLANTMKLSPLGPYHYRMIAEDFEFDTSKVKSALGWAPTLTNEAMLREAYEYYERNVAEVRSRTEVSAHRQMARMGIIRVLKHLC